jgi:transposase
MGVYVGMEVHGKRSQVAVVDDAGVPQRNRNLANDPARLMPILGALAPGTPVAFEAADGWGGWSSCWRSWSWSRTWSTPAAARRSPRPGCSNDKVAAATLAQLLRADLLPRPGSPPTSPGSAGPAGSPGGPGPAVDLRSEPGACRAGRPRLRDHSSRWTGPGRAGLADLALPPTPRGSIPECCGLLDALATRSAGWNARSLPWPSPTHGSRRSWSRPESASSRR